MSASMIHYVLGFAFDVPQRRVLLIRKNRPAWQAGKLNGVGGKVEPGETLVAAMVREFSEETGLHTEAAQWVPCARIEDKGYEVHCFRTIVVDLHAARSMTDEAVEVVPLDFAYLAANSQSNLVTLLANALDRDAPFALLRYRELASAEQHKMLQMARTEALIA